MTYFTRHAHLDDIFKMAENMNSDEIIDEVLSASLTQDYTFLQFWRLYNAIWPNLSLKLMWFDLLNFARVTKLSGKFPKWIIKGFFFAQNESTSSKTVLKIRITIVECWNKKILVLLFDREYQHVILENRPNRVISLLSAISYLFRF